MEKHECRCFETGVLYDIIKQLTSYHALWYVKKKKKC